MGMAAMSRIYDALKQAELASQSRSRLAAARKNPALTVLVTRATDSASRLEPVTRSNKKSSRYGAPLHLIWFFLGVVLALAAVFFLRHYAPGVGESEQAKAIATPEKAPAILPPVSTVENPALVLPAALSSNLPGFVLQVAALKHEENAHTLSETLHQKSFPVFVFKHGAGPFYLVAVGVYGDADSALRVKDELERQGFKPILKRWLPK
jgi:cell division septation protein DedD